MEATYPVLHPLPFLRLGLSLGSTFWTLATAGGTHGSHRALQSWARRVLDALGVQVEVAAPIQPGGQLWVSNHLSWLDPLVYLSLRPSRVLAKAEVAGYPGVGSGARRSGIRFVQRENLFCRASTLRTLARDLRAGDEVLVFPEGTTTHGSTLAPLHEGGLKMAYRLGVKVLPFRVASLDPQYPWVGDAELFPHLRAVARSRSTRVTVHPGDILDPARFSSEKAWLQAIRSQLETPMAAPRGGA
jgi:1-acyl-sn-glycerol-3-phosphate acyltransferase